MITFVNYGIVGLATAMMMLGMDIGCAVGAELLVGTASTSITPERPVALAGHLQLRISQGVGSPLTATALALQGRQGEQRLDQAIMVSCDLILIPKPILEETRRRIQPLLPDFDVSKLVINATHTHTTPVVEEEGLYLIPKDGVMQPLEYIEFLTGRLVDVAAKAWKGRQPGAVGWGLGHAVIARNRRAVYADGKAVMYGDTTRSVFRRLEAYEDHGVEVLFFWNAKRELLAMAVNIACPTQEVEGRMAIDADYWHQGRQRLQEKYGSQLSVVSWVGAGGDQSPHLMVRKAAEDRMRQLRGLTRPDEIAKRIVAAVDEAYEGASKDIRTDVPLVHVVQPIRLPIRRVTDEEFEKVKKRIDCLTEEEKGAPGKNHTLICWLRRTINRYEKQKTEPWHEVELHAIRLGDVAICTNPFELFTDYGVQMKARSKAIQTFVIQLTGARAGYLPTEQAVCAGGYSAIVETNVVGPEGGQMLVERTLEAINSLWPATATPAK